MENKNFLRSQTFRDNNVNQAFAMARHFAEGPIEGGMDRKNIFGFTHAMQSDHRDTSFTHFVTVLHYTA